MKRLRRVVGTCLALVVSTSIAGAASTTIWHETALEEFEKGERENVAISTAGDVSLSPDVALVASLSEPTVWTLAENEAGKTVEVVSRQLNSALAGMASLGGTVIAYEPIWAIGTGKSASGQQANQTIALIRHRIASLFDEETARNIRILYGGSVTADNIVDFVKQPEIDGALVGGASLKAGQFISIVKQTADIGGS